MIVLWFDFSSTIPLPKHHFWELRVSEWWSSNSAPVLMEDPFHVLVDGCYQTGSRMINWPSPCCYEVGMPMCSQWGLVQAHQWSHAIRTWHMFLWYTQVTCYMHHVSLCDKGTFCVQVSTWPHCRDIVTKYQATRIWWANLNPKETTMTTQKSPDLIPSCQPTQKNLVWACDNTL